MRIIYAIWKTMLTIESAKVESRMWNQRKWNRRNRNHRKIQNGGFKEEMRGDFKAWGTWKNLKNYNKHGKFWKNWNLALIEILFCTGVKLAAQLYLIWLSYFWDIFLIFVIVRWGALGIYIHIYKILSFTHLNKIIPASQLNSHRYALDFICRAILLILAEILLVLVNLPIVSFNKLQQTIMIRYSLYPELFRHFILSRRNSDMSINEMYQYSQPKFPCGNLKNFTTTLTFLYRINFR